MKTLSTAVLVIFFLIELSIIITASSSEQTSPIFSNNGSSNRIRKLILSNSQYKLKCEIGDPMFTDDEDNYDSEFFYYDVRKRLNTTWYNNDNTQIVNKSGRVFTANSSLIFEKVQETDAGNYTCKVCNELECKSMISDVIILDENKIKSLKNDEPFYLKLEEGATARFNCNISNSYNNSVYWFAINNESSYKMMNHDDRVEIINGSLILKNVTIQDYGYYYCTLTGNPKDISKGGILKVHKGPTFSGKYMNKNVYAKVGSQFVLKCDARGTPFSVDWYKNYNTKNQSIRQDVRIWDDSLHIENFKTTDIGNYTCVLSNAGGSINFTYDVQIYDKDSFVEDTTNLTLKEGESAVFECKVFDFYETPIDWYKTDLQNNTELFSLNNTRVETIRGPMKLKNLTESDAGTYFCIASDNSSEYPKFGATRLNVIKAIKHVDTALN